MNLDKVFKYKEKLEKDYYIPDEELDGYTKQLENKVDELMELYTTERHCKDDYKCIINELEKTLNNYDLDYMDLVGEHLLADILEDLKDKIKELKGSSNNE